MRGRHGESAELGEEDGVDGGWGEGVVDGEDWEGDEVGGGVG